VRSSGLPLTVDKLMPFEEQWFVVVGSNHIACSNLSALQHGDAAQKNTKLAGVDSLETK